MRLSTVGSALVALAVLLSVSGVAGAAGAAGALPRTPGGSAREASETARTLSIVKVSGLLDPVLVDFLNKSLDRAEAAGPSWVVLQLNSPGAVAPSEDVAKLLDRLRSTDVSIAVWVGPSGAKASGEAGQIAAVADAVSLAPGTSIGGFGDPVIGAARFTKPYRASLDRLRNGHVGASAARKLGLTQGAPGVIGDFIIGLDGVDTRVIQTGNGPRRAPTGASTPVFRALTFGDQVMHTVSSPAVSYLLFVMGMALIVFELFTAGVGVAGLVGAGFFVLGCYGLGVLPVRPWAVGLLVVSMIAFAVDVQTGVPRFWSGVGGVAFLVGSFALFDGVSLSWITLLAGIVGIALFVLAGMPSMVRTRFSTPTIGREWMIGEEGEAVADVAPEGVVRVRGALWRARTNRATPLDAGAPLRVVEVDGLLLEVEPLEGAAKDHRA